MALIIRSGRVRVPVQATTMVRRRLLGERGQGILEFAVIFPIFVLLIFIVIDGGLLMGRYNNMNHAATEGARLLAVASDAAAVTNARSQIKNQAHGLLDGAGNCGPGATDICMQWADGPDGQPAGQVGSAVKVTLKYRYPFLTPLGNWTKTSGFDITSCAVMRLERPMPDPASVSGSGTC